MSTFQISERLANSPIMKRAYTSRDQFFETGNGTKPATRAHERQAAVLAAQRVLKTTARRRPTTAEREKEISRRRTWAGGGTMPANIRAGYSEAERAALAVVADQCRRKGYCDLCIDEIARIAGVGRTSVQNAIRKARSNERAHLSVRERPQRGGKSFTNIIRIICKQWIGWIARAIGFKRLNTSETGVKTSLSESAEPALSAFERECVATVAPHSKRSQFVEKHSGIRGSTSRYAHSFGGFRNGA